MQDAAIAEHRPSRGHRLQLAERRHAILQCHRVLQARYYIWAYGINDFTTDHAKASAVESYAALFKASVVGGVTLVTLDPVSRSSDDWTTPAAGTTNNQRVVSAAINANRVAYNEWCRHRAVGLGYKACLDIASTGEWGHNSGLWTTFDGRTLGNDLTVDGIHRNLLGYKLLQNSGLINSGLLRGARRRLDDHPTVKP